MKYEEIASELNISVNTIEISHEECIRKLRLELKTILSILVFNVTVILK